MLIALLLAACWFVPDRTERGPDRPARRGAPAGDEVGRSVMVKPAERDPRWAEARCNDGTSFGYVFRRGRDSDLWVVNLSGGKFCDDDRIQCSERARRLVTARPERDGAPAVLRGEGIFSTEAAVNPLFAHANHVDAHYCSSDLWVGDSTERRPTTGDRRNGWYFSGRANVKALVEALEALHGLDDDNPRTRILLVGTSAGSFGVVGNLGAIVDAWPNTARDRRLKVVLDGSWIPRVPPALRPPAAARWGPVEPSCDRAARKAGQDPSTCVSGPEWWPHVAKLGVPVLVQISGRDRAVTDSLGLRTPEALADWQRRVKESLEALDGPRRPWVYSIADPYHTVADSERFARGPEGKRFSDVLERFWRGGKPERVLLRYE